MVGVEEAERSLDLGSAGSFSYSSYGEGVVKLFIALCEEAQRVYGDALSGLTLREFQDELVKRVPEGSFAIEDLVSIFEAVSYGGVEPSEKEFEICEASVELLLGLMGGSSLGENVGGKPLSGRTGGWMLTLFWLLLLGGVVVIVLFTFQLRIESILGDLVRLFQSSSG